jgi:A/G-specific adenine glycosylase
MRRASSRTALALASSRAFKASRIARAPLRITATRDVDAHGAMDRRPSEADDLKCEVDVDDERAPSTSTSTRDDARFTDEDARESLLAWYDARARDLPWRRRPGSTQRAWTELELETPTKDDEDEDVERFATMWRERAFETDANGRSRGMSDDQYAYGVLVSEIMSQQTQIERVAEYWRRWTRRWPTATALSRATIEEVNDEWAGLGYYRRAKYLLEGAKYVAGELGGRYPRTVEGLLKIPGVGPYTASAVASIAFGVPSAAIDGNVHRVVTRAKMIRGDPLKGEAAKTIRSVAESLMDRRRAGDFNQAMMELGATTCAPANPKCGSCPIASWCDGLREVERTGGTFRVTTFPETAKKAEKRQEQRAFVVARRRDGASFSYLLAKRPETGLLAGLWEFPNALIATESDESFATRPSTDVTSAQDAVCDALGSSSTTRWRRASDIAGGKVVHVFSHIRQVMHYAVYDIERDENEHANAAVVLVDDPDRELRWFPASAFEDDGVFSSSVAKLYARASKTSTKSSGAQKRRRDAKETNAASSAKNQPSIASFFAPKSS